MVGALAEWDAVPNGDLLGSDEDVVDKQPQDLLTFLNGGDLDLGVQLAEEVFEIGGEVEVGLTVGELGVEGLDLVAQVGFPDAQVGHAGVQQCGDVAPDDGVEVVGADRLIGADPAARVAVVVRAEAPVVADLFIDGAGQGAVLAVSAA